MTDFHIFPYAVMGQPADFSDLPSYPFFTLERELNKIVGRDRWEFLIRGFEYATIVFLEPEDLVKAKMFMDELMVRDGKGTLQEIRGFVGAYY